MLGGTCFIDLFEVTDILILILDMSTAFDTVHHSILCQWLVNCFDVNGTALQWFISYLKGYKSQVNIAGMLSKPVQADFGLPKGSVLGPLLFTAHTVPMGNIAQKCGICYHLYADDCQLYVPFDPQVPSDLGKNTKSDGALSAAVVIHKSTPTFSIRCKV